jgi:hypothetical protein
MGPGTIPPNRIPEATDSNIEPALVINPDNSGINDAKLKPPIVPVVEKMVFHSSVLA